MLEGLVTTLNDDGGINAAPMGPHVDRELTQFTLKPFQGSRTLQNLLEHPEGVFHVVDDVELLARCAVGRTPAVLATQPATSVQGHVLQDACRWYEFRARSIDTSQPRAVIDCEIVAQGRLREFWGFNRAKHAVLEASILATRVTLLSAEEIREQMRALATIVEKTAGDQERRAFEFLTEYIEGRL